MRENGFPIPVDEVVGTLVEIFRHQKRRELVELLENAHAHFDETNYDNWNGGTYTWALRLEVPVHIFASVEPQLEAIEKEIHTKVAHFGREYPNDHFDEVTITPIRRGTSPLGQRIAPPENEVRRLWADGRFRLFVSHISDHKAFAGQLKSALGLRGIHAFVAHEDIEPSLEWQDEIELALRSMHALTALVTPGFHSSQWTDHEIGWALGRGVPVVPIRLGVDPYGLIGKFQGLAGSLQQPKKMAARIAETLLANRQSHTEMRRAAINSFVGASSEEMAKALSVLISQIEDVTVDEKAVIWAACADNRSVCTVEEVCSRIYSHLGSPPEKAAKGVTFSEDDIPF